MPGLRPDPLGALTAVVVLAVGWLAIDLWIEPSDVPGLAAIDCANAVTVDGTLRCGSSAPKSLDEICVNAPNVSIRPGDNLERERICSQPQPTRGTSGWTRMPPESLAVLSLPVNLNEASAEELASFPGIGPALAGRIIEAREQSSFQTLDDLDAVKGVGPRTLERMRLRARTSW